MAMLWIKHEGCDLKIDLGEDGASIGPDPDCDVVLRGVPRFEVRSSPRGWILLPESGGTEPAGGKPVHLDGDRPQACPAGRRRAQGCQPTNDEDAEIRVGGRRLPYPILLGEGATIEAGSARMSFFLARRLTTSGRLEPAPEAAPARDPHGAIETLLQTATGVTGAARGFLLLRRGGSLSLAARHGFGPGTDEADLAVSHTIASRVYRSGHAVHTADARRDHRFLDSDSVQEHAIGSVICAPLLLADEPVGVLYLDRPAGEAPFDHEALTLAEALAAAAGHSLARSPEHRSRLLTPRRARLEPTPDGTGWIAGAHLFVGSTPAVATLMRLVERVAKSDAPVVIWGESGTGKELVARMIHAASRRSEAAFEALSCGSLAHDLLDAELFGYVQGAFTGAYEDRPGLFARADGGTVLLDDVAEMDARLQNRLLRVLDERAVRPVGGDAALPVDHRLLSTTSASLEDQVARGTLRPDLYYRLAAFVIRIPPLRERVDDLPRLAEHFLREQDGSKARRFFRPDTLAILRRHPWPGNVRELRNEVARAALEAGDGDIAPRHLSPRVRGERGATEGMPMARIRTLADLEREAVVQALRHFGGNRAKTARALGMARSTLYKRMEQYDLV